MLQSWRINNTRRISEQGTNSIVLDRTLVTKNVGSLIYFGWRLRFVEVEYAGWVGRVAFYLLLGWQSGLFSDFGLAEWLFLCLWVRREVFFPFQLAEWLFFVCFWVGRMALSCKVNPKVHLTRLPTFWQTKNGNLVRSDSIRQTMGKQCRTQAGTPPCLYPCQHRYTYTHSIDTAQAHST